MAVGHVFLKVIQFSPVNVNKLLLATHLHAALIRTRGRSL